MLHFLQSVVVGKVDKLTETPHKVVLYNATAIFFSFKMVKISLNQI